MTLVARITFVVLVGAYGSLMNNTLVQRRHADVRMRVGTPALLIPRRGPSAEQRMRARAFAERGWVSQLDPDNLDPGRLAGAVLRALDGGPSAASAPPDLGGLARAARALHSAALAARATVTSRRPPAVVALPDGQVVV